MPPAATRSASPPTGSAARRPAGAPDDHDHRPRKNLPMTNPAVADLIARSNRLGADPRNTNYAGGNTSAKGAETDPVTGEQVELVWVKGSGGDLGTLTEKNLAGVRLGRVRSLGGGGPGGGRGGGVGA